MQETVQTRCPICEGTGRMANEADDMFGNTISFDSECWECEGTGELEVRS